MDLDMIWTWTWAASVIKVENRTKPCSGMNTSAPSGPNGLSWTVWTRAAHLQRLGSVGKRITRSHGLVFSTV
eukprot:5148225-Prymnesium_polylepis.1